LLKKNSSNIEDFFSQYNTTQTFEQSQQLLEAVQRIKMAESNKNPNPVKKVWAGDIDSFINVVPESFHNNNIEPKVQEDPEKAKFDIFQNQLKGLKPEVVVEQQPVDKFDIFQNKLKGLQPQVTQSAVVPDKFELFQNKLQNVKPEVTVKSNNQQDQFDIFQNKLKDLGPGMFVDNTTPIDVKKKNPKIQNKLEDKFDMFQNQLKN